MTKTFMRALGGHRRASRRGEGETAPGERARDQARSSAAPGSARLVYGAMNFSLESSSDKLFITV